MKWFPRALLAALLGLVAACDSNQYLSGMPATIEVPLATWPGYEYFYLAKRERLAAQQGLHLETRDYPDPQAIVSAYLRGELDVAQLTTVLVLDESRGADMVAARRGLASVEDLRGRRVAVTPSTLGPYVLSRALEEAGMELKDVQVVPMPMGEMAGSLVRRQVDAAAFFPPFSEYALRVGLAQVLFDSSRIPGEIFDVLVVDPLFALRHREDLVRLLRTWQASHDFADRYPDKADKIMAFREKLSVSRFREAEKGLLYPSLQEQVQLGLVKAGAPLPRVDDEPLRQALAGNGSPR